MAEIKTETSNNTMSSEATCVVDSTGKASDSTVAKTLDNVPSDDGTTKPSDVKKMNQKENVTPVAERDLGWKGSAWSANDVGTVRSIVLVNTC